MLTCFFTSSYVTYALIFWFISQKSWSSKTNNCSFCNKTTQDFAEFWEIWINFKAKTKTEDEGILRKGKRSSSWFFSLHIRLAGREENQIFCYAKHANVSYTSNEKNIAKFMTILKLCERSFNWDLAGCPISFRLEMAEKWRQVVKNLEIQCYLNFMGYLYCNIKIKQIE